MHVSAGGSGGRRQSCVIAVGKNGDRLVCLFVFFGTLIMSSSRLWMVQRTQRLLPTTLLKQNIRKWLKKSYLKGSSPAPLQVAAVPADAVLGRAASPAPSPAPWGRG